MNLTAARHFLALGESGIAACFEVGCGALQLALGGFFFSLEGNDLGFSGTQSPAQGEAAVFAFALRTKFIVALAGFLREPRRTR